MKFRLFLRYVGSLSMLLAALSASGALNGRKPVHLRNTALANETATTASLVRQPTNGLFLIQFHSAPSMEERVQLRATGVELLQYVPEHTFIAKFVEVSPAAIAQFGFVNWIGEYRPEYKIHKALIGGPNTNRPVAVLLHSSATPAQMLAVRQRIQLPRMSEPQIFGTVIRGVIKPSQLIALAQSEAVLWIESSPAMKLNDEVSSKIVAGDGGVNQLYTQSLGFDGSGVNVAVADSGLDDGLAATMHPDLFGRTPTFFYYGTLTDASDEHSHGTHCTGIIAGTGATGETDDNGYLFGLGVAPGAAIITQRIFNDVGEYEAPPSFEKLTRDAKSAGADIGSNSWGDDTQGRYDISAMEFDGLVRDANALAAGDQPYILEFSAGNAGPGEQTIGSPAVGKNVIATGASENDRTDLLIYSDGPETMADFSSRGPCEDGRIKPDIVAPGTWIASAKSSVAPEDNSWSPISDNYLYVGGTSQAGPHVSGAAAIFVQYYRTTHTNATPSPALVKAALINSAVDLDDSFGTTPVPNNDEGWGLTDLTELIGSSRAFSFLDQTALLPHGQNFTQSVLVASSSEPLKITLTYTDVPGFPGAIPALVNDLDLEVTGPDGRVYRGNRFDGDGESVPNAVAGDGVNNVEAVHLYEPLPGEYMVRVHARNVVQDARQDTAGIDQDFALVTSGDLPEPGTGLVILDRSHYRAPGTIRITVLDGDLAGNASASVLVSSSSETNAEAIALFAANNSGKFTNSIATATDAATADGVLQFTNGNTIEVRYFDASSGSNRSAFAIGDFVPPVITAVASTNTFGQRIISWQTDEPSTALVRYDTNASLTSSITNLALTAGHSVALTGLIVNKWYKYAVISTDEAGNTTSNNNNGTLFSFQALPTATLLLVDSYNELFYGSPPLSGYTSALDQLGISYDPWDVASLGASPTLTNLQPYRAVIWRVPDLTGVWSAGERSAISNYVKGGGGLFVASMEVLSRLDEVGASSFWRNVLHVESYVADDTVSQISGTPGAPVGDGVYSILDYSVYDTLWDELIQLGFMTSGDISDTIIPGTNAVSVLTDTGATVGLRWPKTGVIGPGRVVFFPFPLDAVPTGNTNNDERAHLLRNVIQFLVPGVNGLGAVAFDSPAYTVPSRVTVEVADTDLVTLGTITNTFYSTTQTNPVSVTLAETAEPGVFRGTITLVAATNAPAPGTLRVKNGDTIGCVYFDASANATVQATAIVDTNAPTITGVTADPDYVDALISWTTSEDADALVQFGESPFLNRTAIDPALATDHELALTGLRPNRTYYYQVVSRDAAGNTRVNDNNGLLFTFTTLTPLVPPWSDNLNNGATNWSVQTETSSDSEWTLGVPNNGKETSANSPPLAWGSNLDGGSLTYVETFLISPAIDLTGGNNATLRFSHSYDFYFTSWDILNGGELLIITNTALSPVSLAVFADDANFGWEEEEIDLSPFTGQVVYLVWYYQLFSFDASPRPAWLVDDISLTVSNVASGTIQISNNLWQARFILTGPTNFAGKGLSSVISNATPGQYAVTFNPVPFYQTPIAQPQTLAPGGNIVFQGNYTFTDVNSNTIADAWETTFFGGVSSSNRTALTDTDTDGMSDYAEFIAGTDPNNPLPSFRVTATRLTNGTVRLEWPTAPGFSYRVHTSTNAIAWSPSSGWILTSGQTNNQIVTPLSNGRANLFRIEAQPGSLPATFHVSASLLASNTVRLDWNSAADRGYRVLGSTNGNSWLSFSGWIHAISANTSFTLPPRTNGAPTFFRVEVMP